MEQRMEQRIGEQRILNERYVETEVRVPRVVVTEETIEKMVVIPETIRREEIVEETQRVRERIVEVEKPVYTQTYVEVPDIEYIEKIVEVPQTIVQEQIKEVARVHVQEHITYKPKVIIKERIEEVPEIEIIEIPFEKIVEIPEVREQVVIKEIKVDRHVECPVAEYVNVEVPVDVIRKVPVPVQNIMSMEYKIPKIVTRHEKVPIPLYAPRFIEIAVPVEQMDEETRISSEQFIQEISSLASNQYPSLCELETLGSDVKHFHPLLHTDPSKILASWRSAVSDSIHSGIPATTSSIPNDGSRPNLSRQSSHQSVQMH